ncbi:chlorophyll a/b-binding protein [Prochlorococcus marinus]
MSFERLSQTEIIHGRIAMSGILFVLFLEIITKINFS